MFAQRIISAGALVGAAHLLSNLNLRQTKCHCDSTAYQYPLMHKPTVPYGQWDPNWDFKADDKSELKQDGIKTKRGPKRHIILVRHGQYVEVKGDANRILTPLGREQAEETGKRLARMIRSNNMNVTSLRVSNLTRAKETSDIIWQYLKDIDGIVKEEPDHNLNEGKPAATLPWKWAQQSMRARLFQDSARIETAFRRYFYRSDRIEIIKDKEENENEGVSKVKSLVKKKVVVTNGAYSNSNSNSSSSSSNNNNSNNAKNDAILATSSVSVDKDTDHEFEIIVCHGNVIRFFFMRALQLPPEAWLRLSLYNCSLNYFTISPSGNVGCRGLGDVGHLDMAHTTNGMRRIGYVN